jgi:hypothetical protein
MLRGIEGRDSDARPFGNLLPSRLREDQFSLSYIAPGMQHGPVLAQPPLFALLPRLKKAQ